VRPIGAQRPVGRSCMQCCACMEHRIPWACQHSTRAPRSPRSRQWAFDAKRFLREGANLLQIIIRPAVEEALLHKRAYPYPVPTLAVSGRGRGSSATRMRLRPRGWFQMTIGLPDC
jgi:hypothetical protein